MSRLPGCNDPLLWQIWFREKLELVCNCSVQRSHAWTCTNNTQETLSCWQPRKHSHHLWLSIGSIMNYFTCIPFIFPETPLMFIVHIYYCNPPVLMFGRARTAPAIRTPVTRQPLQLVRVSMSAISASVLVHCGVMCSSFCSNHTVCTMLTAQLTMASVMMTQNYHHYQHQIINNPYTGFGPILFVH